MSGDTVTLTTAQAIIRYLDAQFIEIDGEKHRLCGGGFGIFGHGNVTCLGEALSVPMKRLRDAPSKIVTPSA